MCMSGRSGFLVCFCEVSLQQYEYPKDLFTMYGDVIPSYLLQLPTWGSSAGFHWRHLSHVTELADPIHLITDQTAWTTLR